VFFQFYSRGIFRITVCVANLFVASNNMDNMFVNINVLCKRTAARLAQSMAPGWRETNQRVIYFFVIPVALAG
jgi:hypothetical protein